MRQAPLAGSNLYDWIALRRVSAGGVATRGGRWFDAGRRVPSYVADTLAELRKTGLVAVSDPDVSGAAALTGTGIARYDALCEQRQRALPSAEHGASARHGAGDLPEKSAVSSAHMQPVFSRPPAADPGDEGGSR
ncbi:MAG TPA: hypothetical protein VJ757_15035 [Pseudonocardiaceae bacterium]|nr:hypothetical protein [Pseudonocardiaceae bacterium]